MSSAGRRIDEAVMRGLQRERRKGGPMSTFAFVKCGNCGHISAHERWSSVISDHIEHIQHLHPGTWHGVVAGQVDTEDFR